MAVDESTTHLRPSILRPEFSKDFNLKDGLKSGGHRVSWCCLTSDWLVGLCFFLGGEGSWYGVGARSGGMRWNVHYRVDINIDNYVCVSRAVIFGLYIYRLYIQMGLRVNTSVVHDRWTLPMDSHCFCRFHPVATIGDMKGDHGARNKLVTVIIPCLSRTCWNQKPSRLGREPSTTHHGG